MIYWLNLNSGLIVLRIGDNDKNNSHIRNIRFSYNQARTLFQTLSQWISQLIRTSQTFIEIRRLLFEGTSILVTLKLYLFGKCELIVKNLKICKIWIWNSIKKLVFFRAWNNVAPDKRKMIFFYSTILCLTTSNVKLENRLSLVRRILKWRHSSLCWHAMQRKTLANVKDDINKIKKKIKATAIRGKNFFQFLL